MNINGIKFENDHNLHEAVIFAISDYVLTNKVGFIFDDMMVNPYGGYFQGPWLLPVRVFDIDYHPKHGVTFSVERALDGVVLNTSLSSKKVRWLEVSFSKTYNYRGNPCTVGAWCVCGEDRYGGSGVLEWAASKDEAEEIKRDMEKYPQFVDLSVEYYPNS